MRRGAVLKLRPGALEPYRAAHQAVWPEVLKAVSDSHLRNYSIYYKDGWLFSYYEYDGVDYENDMAKMAAIPVVQRWWKLMEKLQEPLPNRKPGEFWASMEELFHLD